MKRVGIKICLYLLGGSLRNTDSSDKQKMFKVKYSRTLSRHYRLLCILNLYDVLATHKANYSRRAF